MEADAIDAETEVLMMLKKLTASRSRARYRHPSNGDGCRPCHHRNSHDYGEQNAAATIVN